MIVALFLSLAPPAVAQQTDTVGGTNGSNDGSGSYKLSVYDTRYAVFLDEFAPLLEPVVNGAEVWFVVYEGQNDGSWELIWDSGPRQLSGGESYKSSGPVDLRLDGGMKYGVGVYIPPGEDTAYYWGDVGGQDLGWALANDARWTTNGTFDAPQPPQVTFGEFSDSPYHQQITVSFGDDGDGDGIGVLADCDDTNPNVYPGAPEACDEVDNDCDGEVDEDIEYRDVFEDKDGDGYGGTDGEVTTTCLPGAPVGFSENDEDCDDSRSSVNPGEEEVCDGYDNDCDGILLPDEDVDGDGDGAPVCSDCDDDDPEIYPGREDDPCNGVDNDCDGNIPDTRGECEEAEGVKIASACGCTSQGGGAPFGLLLPLLVVFRRR